jgi:invasion protein IalB
MQNSLSRTLAFSLSLAALAGGTGLAVAAGIQAPPAQPPATAQAQVQPPGAQATTLPGGASSLQETFGDWQVACMVQGAAKHCATTQEQVNQQSHQRVFAIEIGNAGDKLEGVLLMPFGLSLDRGIALQIDDQPPQTVLRFRTCLPGGCLVPLNFDAKTAALLRNGTTLKAKAVADGGPEQVYTISLKGFSQAIDRVAVLIR